MQPVCETIEFAVVPHSRANAAESRAQLCRICLCRSQGLQGFQATILAPPCLLAFGHLEHLLQALPGQKRPMCLWHVCKECKRRQCLVVCSAWSFSLRGCIILATCELHTRDLFGNLEFRAVRVRNSRPWGLELEGFSFVISK